MPRTWLVRHDRIVLASDACLVSSVAFGLASGLLALSVGPREPAGPIAAALAIGILGTVLAGPALAWRLRRRPATWRAGLGAFAGMLCVVIGSQLLFALGAAISWVLSPVTTSELASPIALLVLGGLGYSLLCSPSLLTLFTRSPAHASQDRPVRIIRLVALIGLGVFMVGAAAFVVTGTNPERAEIFAFAILAGFTGAAMVVGADLVQG